MTGNMKKPARKTSRARVPARTESDCMGDDDTGRGQEQGGNGEGAIDDSVMRNIHLTFERESRTLRTVMNPSLIKDAPRLVASGIKHGWLKVVPQEPVEPVSKYLEKRRVTAREAMRRLREKRRMEEK